MGNDAPCAHAIGNERSEMNLGDSLDTTSQQTAALAEVRAPRPPAKPVNHFASAFREWIVVIFIAIAAAVLMKVFVVQQFYVSGHSMDTTLHDFDRVLVNKLSYDLHDPRRGDIVVLEEAQGLTQRDLI